MNISVKTNALKEKNGSTIAIANIQFGEILKVRNVTVKEGKNGPFISMPSYATSKVDEQGKTIYRDVFNPITKEGRDSLYGAIMESLESGKEVKLTDNVERSEPDFSVRVVPLESGSNGVLAMGRMYLNSDFVVNNITVREGGKDKTPFIAFPSYKTNEVDENGTAIYKDFVYPCSKEAREEVVTKLLDAYKEAKEIVEIPMEKPAEKGIQDKLKSGEEKSKKTASEKPKTAKKEASLE